MIRRTLPNDQKAAYIAAVKCLQREPGVTQHLYPGVRSRYDDYLGTHINITDLYHFSVKLPDFSRRPTLVTDIRIQGPFHPWHRLMVQSYDSDLRRLCGYTGAQP